MKYALIITPTNVLARLIWAAVLLFVGLFFLAQPHSATTVTIAGLLLGLGTAIGVFGLRWFWRLFIVAWFR
ncbi:MAG TPA: hypothetical protein VGM38_09545 [Pseudolysinimonas sp.]